MNKIISVIVPCYNEEESIPAFYEEITKISKKMKNLNFEYIFVDDGSKDNTLNLLREYSKKDKCVKYISFSRNFGKESAMLAGLEYSKGDYVTIMDADLQHPPALLEKMYNIMIEENYDCVATKRVSRKGEPIIRSFFAKLFYKIINKISKVEMISGATDYRLMTRQMVNSIISMKEYNRYSKGIFGFVGFKTKWLEYDNVERISGQSKWSFWNLFVYAIEGITSFSTVPLFISIILGLMFSLLGIILFIVFLVNLSKVVILSSIMFFIGGIQLLCIGIIGQYLSKTYLEIKNRPIYIIRETQNDKKNN